MPRIKRWFPVSHDFLDDPDTIDLIREFGERAVFMWLKMLSWADRNRGLIGSDEASICKSFGRCLDQAHPNQAATRAQPIVRWMLTHAWVELHPSLTQAGPNAHPSGIYTRSHLKYHTTEEKNPSPPNLPNLPNLPKDIYSSTTSADVTDNLASPKPDLSVKDLVDSWNEVFKGRLPQVQWPLSKGRHRKCAHRLKEHSRLDFWQRVFDNIGESRFLLGNGNGNWTCTLDFLIANDTNCVKVYERSYK